MYGGFRGTVALIVVVVLIFAAALATRGVQEVVGEQDEETYRTAGVLVAVGCALVLRDWGNRGPTVALRGSAVAAAAAWFLVVPLGILVLDVEEHLPIIGYAALCVTIIMTMHWACGGKGMAIGAIISVLVMLCAQMVDSYIGDVLGTALIYVAVFWVVRQATTLRQIDHWPDVVELDPNSEEFRDRRDFFVASCMEWAHKYKFQLEVTDIYRVGRDRRNSKNNRFSQDQARHLFHGTPWPAAQGIVSDGFRLPNTAGMFGKGIYFADCPLKSAQYTAALEDGLQACSGRGGIILLCWVDLGEQRKEKAADHSIGGYNRNGWWAWLTNEHGAYDSVVGLTKEEGGALRVPEYIVYNPGNARVDYIFEVERVDPPPRPRE